MITMKTLYPEVTYISHLTPTPSGWVASNFRRTEEVEEPVELVIKPTLHDVTSTIAQMTHQLEEEMPIVLLVTGKHEDKDVTGSMKGILSLYDPSWEVCLHNEHNPDEEERIVYHSISAGLLSITQHLLRTLKPTPQGV